MHAANAAQLECRGTQNNLQTQAMLLAKSDWASGLPSIEIGLSLRLIGSAGAGTCSATPEIDLLLARYLTAAANSSTLVAASRLAQAPQIDYRWCSRILH